jgi:2-oxoglutarate dehydrogenase E2 component (dihydrolipoamide succinyltransferase)
MQLGTMLPQAGQQGPAAAAAPAAPQPQPPAAAAAPSAMDQVRLANMGAALAAAAAQEQAAQAHAAAAQAAAESQAAAAAAAAQAAAEATQQRAAMLAAAQAEELQQQRRQQMALAGSVAVPGGGLGHTRGRSPASEADSGDSGRFTAARSRSDEKKLRKKAKQLRAAEQRAARAAGLGCCC